LFYHWQRLFSVKVYNKERCAVDVGTLGYWRTSAAHLYCLYRLLAGIVCRHCPIYCIKIPWVSPHISSCPVKCWRRENEMDNPLAVCVCMYVYTHACVFLWTTGLCRRSSLRYGRWKRILSFEALSSFR
jgi:hypothetical protein